MPSNPSRLTIDESSEQRVLVLIGEVDSHTTQTLEAAVDALGREADIAIDFADVTFMDSSGLRTLIRVHQECEEAGTKVVVRSPSEPVKKLLNIAGMDGLLHIT